MPPAGDGLRLAALCDIFVSKTSPDNYSNNEGSSQPNYSLINTMKRIDGMEKNIRGLVDQAGTSNKRMNALENTTVRIEDLETSSRRIDDCESTLKKMDLLEAEIKRIN